MNINTRGEKIFNVVMRDKNGNIDPNLEHITLDSFRVFGWIDCIQNITCRPGGGPVNEDGDRRDGEDEIQRAFTSGEPRLKASFSLMGCLGMCI